MSDNDPDPVTLAIVSQLLLKASDRAVAMKEGKYDFALDDQPVEEDGFEEIPEDLQETEEDKEKDRIEEEKTKKFDKVYNIILIALCVIFVGFLIWNIIDKFLL
jgi:hypothetical protein